jgi:hypothetical protein
VKHPDSRSLRVHVPVVDSERRCTGLADPCGFHVGQETAWVGPRVQEDGEGKKEERIWSEGCEEDSDEENGFSNCHDFASFILPLASSSLLTMQAPI